MATISRIALLTVLIGCGVGAMELASEPDGGERQAAARKHVESTCLRCHPVEQLTTIVGARIGERQASDALDAFLGEHHVPDAALRGDVIEYLARLAAFPSERQ